MSIWAVANFILCSCKYLKIIQLRVYLKIVLTNFYTSKPEISREQQKVQFAITTFNVFSVFWGAKFTKIL